MHLPCPFYIRKTWSSSCIFSNLVKSQLMGLEIYIAQMLRAPVLAKDQVQFLVPRQQLNIICSSSYRESYTLSVFCCHQHICDTHIYTYRDTVIYMKINLKRKILSIMVYTVNSQIISRNLLFLSMSMLQERKCILRKYLQCRDSIIWSLWSYFKLLPFVILFS